MQRIQSPSPVSGYSSPDHYHILTNLDRLLQIENFAFCLITHHAGIHLRIHHFNSRHTLKQTEATQQRLHIDDRKNLVPSDT